MFDFVVKFSVHIEIAFYASVLIIQGILNCI